MNDPLTVFRTLSARWRKNRAHTYASENADHYRGFDAGLRRCADELDTATQLAGWQLIADELDTATQLAGWQPIETAPMDGQIIVDVWLGECDEEERQFYCTPGSRRSCNWSYRQGRFRPATGLALPVVTVRPTHWMPLPAPPQDPLAL